MSVVPPSTFADWLRRLDRREFTAFVADVWAASGWKTEVEESVVVARRGGEQQRLLVVPARRLEGWRQAPAVEGAVDRVVTARRIDGRDELPRGTPDAPVVDADDLRRRLLYGVDADDGERICSETLGLPLRDDRWAEDGRTRIAPSRALAVVGLAAIAVVALVAVAGGVPGLFVGDGGEAGAEGDDPASGGEPIVLSEGVDLITVGDAEDVAAGPTVYVGAFDGAIYAVDAQTGDERWRFDDPEGVFSSPTVVDGTVYVGGLGETVYAVDAQTGGQEWAYDDPDDGVFSSPTVVNASGGDGAHIGDTVYVGSDDGVVHAVDADTGLGEWSADVSTFGVFASPAVGSAGGDSHAGDAVYVGTGDGELVALDAATGDERWRFDDPDRGILASPTVVDGGSNETGTVYVGTNDGTVYAVDAATGDPDWTVDLDSPVFASPTVVDDSGGDTEDATVYVASENGTLAALDAATGDPDWTADGFDGKISASPTVDEGTVYAISSNGTMYALDAERGTVEVNASVVELASLSSPTVADDAATAADGGNRSLFVGGDDGILYAVDADTGEPTWTFDDPAAGIASSPTVVADPIDGNSVDSRVRHGTLGHHDRSAEGATVPDDPEFRILNLAGPPTVEAGERTTLTARITNAGAAGMGTVEWHLGGEPSEAVDLDLEAGESATVELATTLSGDVDELAYEVRTPDATAHGSTTVVGPASFQIVDVTVRETGGVGERIELEATIHNAGDRSGATDVELEIDGETVDVQEERVGDGTAVAVVLSFTPDAPGERAYAVTTADDRHEGTLEVDGASSIPGFGIAIALLGLVGAAVALRSRRSKRVSG